MTKKQYVFLLALIFCGLSIIAWAQGLASMGNVSGCGDFDVILFDSASKAHKCGIGATLIYRAKGINLNAGANTDVTPTITNLPARYIVRRVTFENASGTPTLATISLRTAAAGGGTAVVNAQALASLSATTVYLDATLAVTSTALTASTLTFRNIAAAGGAMTVDATVEIVPLN